MWDYHGMRLAIKGLFHKRGTLGARLLGVVGVLLLCACDLSDKSVTIDLDERVNESALQPISLADADPSVFVFGFDQRASPQEDARQYLPFLAYLERSTGYRFKLRFTPKDGQVVDDLGTGVIQFAAIGAESYIRAHEKYGVIPLVRGLNRDGKAEYQSVIVVKPDSAIKDVSQLRGKRFAFGSMTSTQGHVIPRIVLSKHKITLQDLSFYTYTGSHQSCATAVVSGQVDACGMQDAMGRRLARQGLVRILHTSDFYPSSGIAANPHLPKPVLQRITQAMLDFEPQGRHAEGLYNWEFTEMPNGFSKAHEEDYEGLRDWSARLGLKSDNKQDEAL